jgi:hypothetical protein
LDKTWQIQPVVPYQWATDCKTIPFPISQNGEFILIGGRKSFSYEFIPKEEGQRSAKSYPFPYLYKTSDID